MTRIILASLILLFLITGCDNNSNVKRKLRNRNANKVPLIEYSVNKTYPHSTNSYTEGLLFHDNKLFESTGSPEIFQIPGR
ncbi:MAG: glutaminyl-peptide cyclotransferase [Chloroflexia bacterium]|nr:glutaminyl-peptide cyclotransferase [Chloroflexia bacterium]